MPKNSEKNSGAKLKKGQTHLFAPLFFKNNNIKKWHIQNIKRKELKNP